MKNIDYYLHLFSKTVRRKNGKIEKRGRTTIFSGLCQFCQAIFYTHRIDAIGCSRECVRTNLNYLNIGDKNGNWKGGTTTRNGYRVFVRNKKRVKVHRHIMEAFIGRQLRSHEIVHHINENKLDNRIENLCLMTHAEHSRHHDNLHKLSPRAITP